jgi:kynurenine formamidase
MMCDGPDKKDNGWQGWSDLPVAKMPSPTGGWIDLSHSITETLSRYPVFPQPRIKRIVEIPPANVTEVHMVVHHGTHVDAPCHFIADGPSMDQVPLDRLYGPGVVWRLDLPARAPIEPKHLEAATPRLQEGDIVLLDTGWASHVNKDTYEDHPYVTGEAAAWLADRGAKLLGVDYSSPDMAPHYRADDYGAPVHTTLLSRGVLISEHVTNLRELAGHRIEAMFLALNIGGSDGAPTRAVARRVD